MKKIILIGLMLCLAFSSLANDKLFKKLNKIYQKDPDKCLEVSKLYIKKFPKETEPYYFMTIVNKDKYMATSSLSNQYGLMGQMLFYASVFDVRGKLAIKEKVSWLATRKIIESEAQVLIKDLILKNHTEKSKKLSKKLHILNNEYPEVPEALIPKNTEPEAINVIKNNVEKEMEIANLDSYNASTSGGLKLFFGKPTGTEKIEPYSISAEKELIKIINEARVSKGLKPLVYDENLANAARYHAYDMASQAYFEHDSHDRVNDKLQKVAGTFDRIKTFYTESFVNSENIAAGSATAQGTYKQWYNSPGHNKNMFNAKSKKVGIGLVYLPNSMYGYYWVFCTAQ
jgi:uncharacterized protein YkwD